ncbi:uncharacterized protein LOC108164246 [Drosophila miranda]|uniref:uncharacterized protein LOC108164246 n=1 Tax=Drosophila miranda TaxID=7229 RepID=UPI00143F782F|nr:uncharacterized protein LOC108164246 [Drosophila miranda]
MSVTSQDKGQALEIAASRNVFEELLVENPEGSVTSSVVAAESTFEDYTVEMVSKSEPEKPTSSQKEFQEKPKPSATPKTKPGKEIPGKKDTKKSPRSAITPPKTPRSPSKKPQKTAQKPMAKKPETPKKKEPKRRTSPKSRLDSMKEKVSSEGATLQPMRSPSITSKLSVSSRSSRKLSKRVNESGSTLKPAQSFKIIRSKPKPSPPVAVAQVKSEELIQDEALESSDNLDNLDNLDHLDTSQTNVVETEVVVGMDIDQRLAFLEGLKELPDIQDLSETTTIEESIPDEEEGPGELQGPQTAVRLDTGRFVEAFASSEHSDSDPSLGQSQPRPEYESQDRTDTTSTDSSEISLDGLYESDVDYPEPLWTEDSVIDICKSMASIVQMDEEVDTVIEIGDDLYKVQHQANAEACDQLLNQLIDKAVDYAESDYVRMTRILDKDKMMKQLYKLIVIYKTQSYCNAKLDSLVSELYLRKKCMSFITGTSASDAFSKTRYQHALLELDNRLKVELHTEKMRKAILSRLREEAEAARIEADEKVRNFEDNVRKNLCFRDDFDHLKKLVGEVLLRISTFRDDVDEVREGLLLAQHTHASLKIKLEKMETLDDGLKIHEYMSNQATNQSLSIKIQERSAELKRLYRRITYDIHGLAHWKNKELMNQNILSRMKLRLERGMQTREDLRLNIYKSKIRHNNLIKEKENIRAAGRLMHYPVLMRDYDVTVEQVEAKRDVVKKLRLEHDRLERRVQQVAEDIAQQQEKLRNIRSLTLLK